MNRIERAYKMGYIKGMRSVKSGIGTAELIRDAGKTRATTKRMFQDLYNAVNKQTQSGEVDINYVKKEYTKIIKEFNKFYDLCDRIVDPIGSRETSGNLGWLDSALYDFKSRLKDIRKDLKSAYLVTIDSMIRVNEYLLDDKPVVAYEWIIDKLLNPNYRTRINVYDRFEYIVEKLFDIEKQIGTLGK
jgi:hypothetical protein